VPAEGSDAFNDWLNNDDPSDSLEYLLVTVFNITNPEAVLFEAAVRLELNFAEVASVSAVIRHFDQH